MEADNESFYLTLMSQYDHDIFPRNTPAEFKNRLARQGISVTASNYEIAVAEFSFRQKMRNHDDKAELRIFDFLAPEQKEEEEEKKNKKKVERDAEKDDGGEAMEVDTKEGIEVDGKDEDGDEDGGKNAEKNTGEQLYGVEYSETIDQSEIVTAEDLCGTLNNIIYTKVRRIKSLKKEIFNYDRKMRRIWVRFHPADFITLTLCRDLLYMLGVCTKDKPIDTLVIGRHKKPDSYEYPLPDIGKTETRKFCPKFAGLKLDSKCTTSDFFILEPHLYPIHDELVIYSSIVSETHFAGFKASIAKIVAIDRENQGRRMCLTWGSSRVYRPLSDNHLSIITTSIRAPDGSAVDLIGHVRLLLHIRKKRGLVMP